jgi:hypothetical protein
MITNAPPAEHIAPTWVDRAKHSPAIVGGAGKEWLGQAATLEPVLTC